MKNNATPRARRIVPRPGLTAEQVAAEMSEREPFFFDDPEDEAQAEAAIAQADAEFASRKTNVNFRWESAPLDVVRQAADLAGVPYQTWMKQVLYQQAVLAITAAREVDPRARKIAGSMLIRPDLGAAGGLGLRQGQRDASLGRRPDRRPA